MGRSPLSQWTSENYASGLASDEGDHGRPLGRLLDLAAFRPSAAPPGGRWEHHIRPLDVGYRVSVPEVRQLSAFDGRLLTTRLSGRWW